MNLFKNEKTNNQRGSATIEAIISFSGFLFVIFTILNIVNFCRAQMLISNAVDAVAKEITQYSYFYKMSGLDDFSKQFADSSETGKNNLNDVVGTLDTFFTAVGTAKDDTVQKATEVSNSIKEGDLDVSNIEIALQGLQADGSNINTSMSAMKSAFDSVKDNPLIYIKSLAAIAGNEALNFAKSRLIAAPLARSFVVKHFGETEKEADDMLKSLGVVDGLDGLNFNTSSIFSSDAPEDVHIVVYYKLKLPQVFEWVELEANMRKDAVARAWLGGDDVTFTIPPNIDLSETPQDKAESESNESDVSEGTDQDEEQKVEETPSTPMDTSDSYWHAYDEGYGYKTAAREAAFWKDFVEENNIDLDKPGYYSQEKLDEGEESTKVYFESSTVKTDNYQFGCGFYMNHAMQIQNHIDEGYLPDTIKSFTYILYVPENMPTEEVELLEKRVSQGSADYAFFRSGLSEETKEDFADVAISVVIKPAGGVYDYESGWLDNE